MRANAGLWKLAGRVYHEAILQGQMAAAGSNVTRLTERMQRDSGYIGKQGRMIQILGSFYLLMVAFVSVTAFLEVRTGNPSAWNLLVASGSVSVQLLIQSGYLIMLTILATAEILAPDLYRWLESLPLSRPELGSLRIFALAREFLLPLGMIVVATPLVAGIAGGSFGGAIVGLFVGVEHAAVTLGFAVLASWRMRRVLRGADGDDRKARMARVVTMVVYGVGTLLVVFIMQIGTNALIRLFDAPAIDASASLAVIRVLALLPLPTAPATLLVAVVTGTRAIPVWMPVIGTLLYGGLAVLLLTRVAALVRGIGSTAPSHASAPSPAGGSAAASSRRPLVVRTAREAFALQIRNAMTRDTQVLISLIFPVILPLLGSIGPVVSGGPPEVAAVMGVVMAILGGGWMVIHGLTRLQFGSGALESTLPVRERDRVVPRLRLAAALPTAGALLPPLLLLRVGSDPWIAGLVQAACIPVVAPAGMLVKLALFGRVRSGSNPIVLDEVRTSARFWKWTAVVGLLGVFAAAIIVGYGALSASLGNVARVVMPAAAVLIGVGEVVAVRRMFP